jgi:hypothetical protein
MIFCDRPCDPTGLSTSTLNSLAIDNKKKLR